MNLFSPILRLFGIGALSNKDKGAQYGGSSTIATDAGISVTDERAMQVSAVWACVQLIANSVASLPLNFYRKDENGRKELERHYLTDIFHRSPNAHMKPRDFRLAMTTQMALWNNAYAEIVFSGERPVALLPLRPGRMTPVITENGELTYHYSVTYDANNSGVRVYAKKSILHLKGFGTDGVVGLERNGYARPALGLSVSADTYAAKQFANGGRSGGGYLMFDDFLTKEQREQARLLYSGMSETAYNAGKLWLLEGGVKYEADTIPPDTMQMLQTRSMQLSEIARFFGVPEVLIGAGSNTSSAWPASFEAQQLFFLQNTLKPYLDEWEAAIGYSLISQPTIVADHDESQFIKMDSAAKGSYWSTLVQNGLATRNEARKTMNLPRMDGGDDLTVQTNLSPLDLLDKINDSQAKQPNRAMQPQIRQ